MVQVQEINKQDVRQETAKKMKGSPGGSDCEASACSAGDLGSIPVLGRSLGEGNGNPFQYSCLENPMDGGAWWATVRGVAKSRTQLSHVRQETGVACFKENS